MNNPRKVSIMVIPVSPPADLLRTTRWPRVLSFCNFSFAMFYSPTFESAFFIIILLENIIMKRITAIAEA